MPWQLNVFKQVLMQKQKECDVILKKRMVVQFEWEKNQHPCCQIPRVVFKEVIFLAVWAGQLICVILFSFCQLVN